MQNKDRTSLFREAPVQKAVFFNTIPAMLSMLMVLAYNLADTLFVGMTQDAYMVAAVSFALPVFMLALASGTLLGIGGTSVISRALGAGHTKRAKQVSAFCFWAGIGIGLLCLAVFALGAGQISHALGAVSAQTYQYTKDYLSTVAWSAPMIVIANAFSNILRAEGQSIHAMLGITLGNLVNLILDPIMILGCFGCPAMGIRGAALATVIGNLVGAAYYVGYFLLGQSMLSIRLSDASVRDRIPIDVISVGIPASLISLLMSVATMVINGQMVAYGDLAVAGYGVAIKVHMVISTLIVGLGQGVQPLLGYCYGAGLMERYHKIFRFSMVYATVVAIMLTAGSMAFAGPLVGLFLSDATAYALGVRFSYITLSSGPFFGAMYIMLNALQAMGRSAEPPLISLSRRGFIPTPLVFILQAALGMNGLVWAQPVADIVATAWGAALYFRVIRSINQGSHPDGQAY